GFPDRLERWRFERHAELRNVVKEIRFLTSTCCAVQYSVPFCGLRAALEQRVDRSRTIRSRGVLPRRSGAAAEFSRRDGGTGRRRAARAARGLGGEAREPAGRVLAASSVAVAIRAFSRRGRRPGSARRPALRVA